MLYLGLRCDLFCYQEISQFEIKHLYVNEVDVRSRKTAKMLLLEATDPKKRTIEQIMIDLYVERGSGREAARAMGITNAAYSLWMYRLEVQLPTKSKVRSGEQQPLFPTVSEQKVPV